MCIRDRCEVIRGCDIAFEAIYAEYNMPVMKACLREKCHYSDLFGSPAEGPGVSKDETIGAQLALDEEFKKNDLLAVPSVGISPGWTSLAAQSVIDKLDKVNDVIIRFADCLDTEEMIPPINAGILALEFFGPPSPMRVVHGEVEPVDLVSSREVFEFPEPIGKRRIYTVTEHPDIVMIPQYCGKDVHVCEEKFGWFLGDLSVEDIWIKTLQMATSEQGTEVTNVNIMEEMSKNFLLPTEYGRLVAEGKLREHYACYTVEVNGWKDGSFVSHILYYNADLKTAQKYLPVWGSPPVYATVGGTPIELVLACLLYTSSDSDDSASGSVSDAEEGGQLILISASSLTDESITGALPVANLDFYMNCIGSLCGNDDDAGNIAIDVKSVSPEYITVPAFQTGIWLVLTIVILPLGILITGFIIWFKRRKK